MSLGPTLLERKSHRRSSEETVLGGDGDCDGDGDATRRSHNFFTPTINLRSGFYKECSAEKNHFENAINFCRSIAAFWILTLGIMP
jgi:hypothetical protein